MTLLTLKEEVERLTAELLARTEQAEWLEERILTLKLKRNEFV